MPSTRAPDAAAAAFAAFMLATPRSSRADLPPLIPRETLFGNPERVGPQISPDGKRLAFIAPDTKNVLQVWGGTLGITMTRLPCVLRVAPNVVSGGGFSGHGVALSGITGRIMAEAMAKRPKLPDVGLKAAA